MREQMEQTKKQFACWHLKRNKNQIHMLKTPQTKNTYLIFKQNSGQLLPVPETKEIAIGLSGLLS